MMLKAEVVFLLPEDGSLAVLAAYPPEDQLDANDLAAAEWCWRSDTPPVAARTTCPVRRACSCPCAPAAASSVSPASRRSDRAVAHPGRAPPARRAARPDGLAIDRVQLARVDATKLLAETERLRTALLTSIGHDLKTPLASILGAVSALRSYGASTARPPARTCWRPPRKKPSGWRSSSTTCST